MDRLKQHYKLLIYTNWKVILITIGAFSFLSDTFTQTGGVIRLAIKNTLKQSCFASFRAYHIEIEHSKNPVIINVKDRSLLVLTGTLEMDHNRSAGTWPPPVKVSISVDSFCEIFRYKKLQNSHTWCEILMDRIININALLRKLANYVIAIIWPSGFTRFYLPQPNSDSSTESVLMAGYYRLHKRDMTIRSPRIQHRTGLHKFI